MLAKPSPASHRIARAGLFFVHAANVSVVLDNKNLHGMSPHMLQTSIMLFMLKHRQTPDDDAILSVCDTSGSQFAERELL